MPEGGKSIFVEFHDPSQAANNTILPTEELIIMNIGLRTRSFTLGMVLLGVLTGCAQDQRWRSAMQEGNAAMRSGDYTHAEESFVAARDRKSTRLNSSHQ